MTFRELQELHQRAMNSIWGATRHLTVARYLNEGQSMDDALSAADDKMLEILLEDEL